MFRLFLVSVHAQIVSLQSAFRNVHVQTFMVCNESSIMCAFLAGGYKEPGKDRTAGRCPPRPCGSGEGPAAGQ